MMTKAIRRMLVLGILLWAPSCHKVTGRPVLAPPPKSPSPPAPTPPVPVPSAWPELPLPPSRLSPPPEPPLPKDFRDGEANFLGRKYKEAAVCYERFLRDDPTRQYKDVAMFKLGISYALACSPGDCAARSREQLNRLISSYPQSPYSAEARFIMSLLGDIEKLRTESKAREEQIKKLEDELARLKAIDLKRQSPTIKK